MTKKSNVPDMFDVDVGLSRRNRRAQNRQNLESMSHHDSLGYRLTRPWKSPSMHIEDAEWAREAIARDKSLSVSTAWQKDQKQKRKTTTAAKKKAASSGNRRTRARHAAPKPKPKAAKSRKSKPTSKAPQSRKANPQSRKRKTAAAKPKSRRRQAR